MGTFINEKEATSRILNHIKEINKLEDRNIEFLGFKDNEWIGRDTLLIIRCNIHNTVTETRYKVFQNRKTWGCVKCKVAKSGRSIMKIQTKEEAISLIQSKIESEKERNHSLEFLGFVGEFKSISSTKILIRCTIHNQIGEPIIRKFLEKGYSCPKCKGLQNKIRSQITNQEIYNRLVKKFGNKNYDFSSILKEEERGTGKDRQVTFYCKIHKIFITKGLWGLLRMKGNIPCHDCYIENNQEKEKNRFIQLINDSIEFRKTLGFNLEFLGFAEDWKGCNTKIILKCITHDYIWKTTTAKHFISRDSISACPECSKKYKYEQICYNILKKKLGINDIERYHAVKCFDPILNKERTLYIDLYSKSLNKAFEYDGPQHYDNTPWFHNSLEEYKDQVRRDNLKEEYCKSNNIQFLRITYRDNNRLEEVIKAFVKNNKNTAKKLTPKEYPDQ